MKKPSQRYIKGTITNLHKQAVKAVAVQAYYREDDTERLIGKTRSDEQGYYTIELPPREIKEETTNQQYQEETHEQYIRVEVSVGNKKLGEKEVKAGYKAVQTINIRIDERLRLSASNQRRLENLKIGLEYRADKDKLEQLFIAVNGDWEALVSSWEKESQYDTAAIEQLRLTRDIAEIAKDYEPIVKKLFGSKYIRGLGDIALNYNEESLYDLVCATGYPDDTPGKDEEEKMRGFTEEIADNLFRKAPGAVLHRMVKEDELPIGEKKTLKNLDYFLDKRADLDLRRTSILHVLNEKDSMEGIAIDERGKVEVLLKNLQRLTAVSPKARVVPELMNAGFDSAYSITNIPINNFVARHGERLGGEDIAKAVHRAAQNVTVRNEVAFMSLREAITGTGVQLIGNNQPIVDRIALAQRKADEKNIPINFSTLFGNVDLCECEHCNSVYSPAAYLVELFQYLRNNNLAPDNPNTGKEGIADTPLEQFFRRRPDLGWLELTCENTHTVLPYIDLVNEVMESFVVHLEDFEDNVLDPKQATIEVHNISDESTQELLSEPLHTNMDAYRRLANEVYPVCKLPYHQPIDAIRLYLDFLKTSRYQVMKTFRKANNPEDPASLTADEVLRYELDLEAQERALDAEYLKLTQEEYVILTKEAFQTRERMNLDAPITEQGYLNAIGIKEVWEYYGIPLGQEFLLHQDLSWVKPAQDTEKVGFLRRTNISYVDLVELLKTRYLNPYFPEGKELAFFNSIRFSYRYLQLLVDQTGTNFQERLEPIVKILRLQFNESNEFSRGFIACWVYRHFERIGKLIVLENGEECQCIEGTLNLTFRFSGQVTTFDLLLNADCSISQLDGQQTIGQVGYVASSSGKLVFTEAIQNVIDAYLEASETESSAFFTSVFNGTEGEEGVYVPRTGELVLKPSKSLMDCNGGPDTCDISKVRLKRLDGTDLERNDYDRIHRFIRLWCKSGWSIEELDKAFRAVNIIDANVVAEGGDFLPNNANAENANEPLVGLPLVLGNNTPSPTSPFSPFEDSDHLVLGEEDIDEEFCQPLPLLGISFGVTPIALRQMVAIKKIQVITGLETKKLLTLWGDIDTTRVDKSSLYARLFLKYNQINESNPFKDGSLGVYLIEEGANISGHFPILISAFKIKAEQLQLLIDYLEIDDDLTIENVSQIYRHILLAKSLGIKVNHLPMVLDLLSELVNPFIQATDTLHFIELYQRIAQSGFKIEELVYVLPGESLEASKLQPTQGALLSIAIELRNALLDIEQSHADLLPEEMEADESFEALIRSKLGLLYEESVVEEIMQFLDGKTAYVDVTRREYTKGLPATDSDAITEIFNDWRTDEENSPGSDVQHIAERAQYSATGGIQVIGILDSTDWDQIHDSLLLPAVIADAEDRELFEIALRKIRGQASQFFRDVLNPIFGLEEGAIEDDLLLEPDNTEDKKHQEKRRHFMGVFMPYLREVLQQRAVTEILSSAINLGLDITESMVMEIIQTEEGVALYEEIIKLKEQKDEDVGAVGTQWTGYFVPPKDGKYRFIVEAIEDNAMLVFNGENAWSDVPTPDDEGLHYFQSPVYTLKAGYAYTLDLTNFDETEEGEGDFLGVYWKIDDGKQEDIPISALFPALRTENFNQSFIQLHKAALLIGKFEFELDEVLHFRDFSEDFDQIDFNALTLTHWFRLEAYNRLKISLPHNEFRLIDLFRWANQETAVTELLAFQIQQVTEWEVNTIEQLLLPIHFDLADPQYFRNEINLSKLQIAVEEAQAIGVDIPNLFIWGNSTSDFNQTLDISRNVKQTIQGRYLREEWEVAIKPVHDQLREHQKQALIAFLLAQPALIEWGAIDADSLFEFFLIDVQMDACMETSRIKQAISSVQLYVQRCFLGLEKPDVLPDELDKERWGWMERYRVWEANRKVFLYPENWLEPELRDIKSPFFKELEGELLQNDISEENANDLLKKYLFNVDKVSNLEITGLFVEGKLTKGKLHVFGRTRTAPFFFYYRYCEVDRPDNFTKTIWHPWEQIDVDITSYDVINSDNIITGTGCFIIPVVWQQRLFIFFPQFFKKQINIEEELLSTDLGKANRKMSQAAEDSSGFSKPVEYWEIKLAWSEYRNNRWTQKKVSSEPINGFTKSDGSFSSPTAFAKSLEFEIFHHIDKYVFSPIIRGSRVQIEVHYNGNFKKLDFAATIVVNAEENGSLEVAEVISHDEEVNDFLKLDYIWNFNGNSIHKEFDSDNQRDFPVEPNNFNKVDNEIYSLQAENQQDPQFLDEFPFFQNDNLNRSLGFITNSYSDIPIFHEHLGSLLGILNSGNLTLLFQPDNPLAANILDSYGSNNNELQRPNAIYNWELLFHSVSLIACNLSKAQQFEQSYKWWHYIFNPQNSGNSTEEAWQFRPFRETNPTNVLEQIFNSLEPNVADNTGNINRWRNNPFKPHVVASSRPTAYMKWVVTKYIGNLIDWGDALFRQFTIESLNQATQLYILAGHILGPRSESIPKRGERSPKSYMDLVDQWDAFGNAIVDLEIIAPFSSQIDYDHGEDHYVNIFGFGTTLYFCLPNNPKLLAYWDTVADRLFKIRNCMDIDGVVRKLKLFEDPIDPALLMQATDQGLSLGSVLSDLNSPMPNYRFKYLVQKGSELTSELKSLSNSLLSALEKKDNETISVLRANHDASIQQLVMTIREQQLEEAEKALQDLQSNRKAIEFQLGHYQELIGEDVNIPGLDEEFTEIENDYSEVHEESGLKLISLEKEEMDKSKLAADLQTAVGSVEALASILHLLPTFGVKATPMGIGTDIKIGGTELGNMTQAIARGLQIGVSRTSFQSSQASKKGSYFRQLQDRIFQANLAGHEIKQIDRQITSQQIRIEIAKQEIANQQQQIDNAAEVEVFLRNKYSNEYLYQWMADELKKTYKQAYNLAFDLANKAEKVFQFEKGVKNSNFIQFGYWDNARDGLLSGEKLHLSLKQLENAYIETKGYDYEITKHVSLLQINPLALMELKTTGVCEFELPETLFDFDYPGHYKRRIKTLSITIPCVVGPYSSVNATLRLLHHEYRNVPILSPNYSKNLEGSEERFISDHIHINAIAVSHGQNDSGVFELNFNGERFLPFEGAGAISRWRLELPQEYRSFDYQTISDVIVHLRYTALEGGVPLKTAALSALDDFTQIAANLGRREGLFRMFDLKHEFSHAWYQFLHPVAEEGQDVVQAIELGNLKERLPFFVRSSMQVTVHSISFLTSSSFSFTEPNALVIRDNDGAEIGRLDSQGANVGTLNHFIATDLGAVLAGNWTLQLEGNANLEAEDIADGWLILKYEI